MSHPYSGSRLKVAEGWIWNQHLNRLFVVSLHKAKMRGKLPQAEQILSDMMEMGAPQKLHKIVVSYQLQRFMCRLRQKAMTIRIDENRRYLIILYENSLLSHLDHTISNNCSEMTKKVLIQAKQAALPSGLADDVLIEVEGGYITKVTSNATHAEFQAAKQSSPDAEFHETDLVVAGFVDIHTHGVGGNDELLEYWLYPEFSSSRVVKYGTTSIVASITFPKDDTKNIDDVIGTLVPMIGKPFPNRAVIDGIHAEGPIVADLGGLVPGENQMPVEDFTRLVDKMGSALKVMTISPSMDSASGFSRMKVLKERNVTISIGHDRNATEDQINGAFRLGTEESPCHVTHIFNVQSFHHRDMGIANFSCFSGFPNLPEFEGLVEPTVEVVGDLLHVHPLVIQLILKAKHWSKIAFITDSFLEPSADHSISYGGRQLEVARVKSNCCPRVVLKGTKTMAGSCTTMIAMFQYLVNVFRVPIDQASQMCSANPARITKLKNIGSIGSGYRADLLLLNKDLSLKKTIIHGDVAFEEK
ncbi:N-acetylglucosamine-6-phosphate deacetylase-like [Planoprotostelium fungivorum]|uniref:N-acetylglucosamine-6-phosphate deacetylase-like n=1 Tax=Planoprotostelium fungivorum TaxID=1890364 RepID=A0A2P6NGT0_9EUKA|nr:N-acetylglucosamine-6-phosphate deacetylase-like [Planoprotostelium fungivorum]